MELAEKIYEYYIKNKDLLDSDKLFHFGSRIAAWRGDLAAYDILHNSYDLIVQPNRQLDDVISEIVNKVQTGKSNAYELRKPFFEKYPKLYGAQLALFRVRHLETIYGIDARNALFNTISMDELEKLEQALLNDDEALKILSTYAINYCYVLERVIKKNEHSLPLEKFLEISKKYDTNQIKQIQLLIYFYTHCIIGESNFYSRNIKIEKLPIYRQMLEILEKLITKHFDKINLDNKLEFLVCARICRYDSKLFGRIYKECEKSVSPDGTFIIDRLNQNAQNERNNFVSSEHRNVLFIMSTTEYFPHSTLI